MTISVQPAPMEGDAVWRMVTWGLRVVVSTAFILPAAFVLAGQTGMTRELDEFGEWSYRVVAGLQIGAAALVLLPFSSFVAAVLLLIIDLATVAAELVTAHGAFIHLILFALPLTALIVVQSRGFVSGLQKLDR